MKTTFAIILGLVMTIASVSGQDTLYVYKGGVVAYKTVISEVDSVTFQKVYAPPVVPVIGVSYGGGIVAYILQPSDAGYNANVIHGLIAAPSDQSTGIQWYNGSNTYTYATGTAIGTGNSNTNTIVASQGAGAYAAKICADLVLGGYSDWYLPSMYELNKLYLNKTAIGGFAADKYWSSSEVNSGNAFYQLLNSGSVVPNYKIISCRVRAIRSF